MRFSVAQTKPVLSADVRRRVAPRIGLPRALLAYRYFPLWHRFLTGVGCTVVTSPPTNKDILAAGIRLSVDDVCIPVKAFIGHLLYLKARGVDAIMAPRVFAIEDPPKRRFTCPKFMGLPDLARAILGGSPPLLDADLDVAARPVADTFVEIGRMLGRKKKASLAAYRVASDAQARFDDRRAAGWGFNKAVAHALGTIDGIGEARGSSGDAASTRDADLLVATIGHPYLLSDRFLSFSLEERLGRLGARLIDPLSIPPATVEAELTKYWELSWSYEREILGAVSHLMARTDVDGIVFLTSFACGTFPVTSEIIEREVRRGTNKPVLYLMVDELTGEAGVQTRLESFCDLLRARHDRAGDGDRPAQARAATAEDPAGDVRP